MDSSANARLEILYRQCYPSLYRYALWALRDHHQAEEAVQETFLSALPKAAEVTALDRPEGWLMQTVKHKVLHLRREQDRRRARMLPLEEKLPAPDRLGQWEESEDAALLWQQATQRLSPQDAELLRLVALEEQSQQAAAEEMGLSLWACQKRLQRIRKKLRAQRLGCTLLAAVMLSALIALPAAGQKCLLPAGLTWQQVTDSAQIQSQLLDATLGADGLLTLSYSVSAWGIMHALGAEQIVIWRQVDETSWVEALRYDETTAALWTAEGQHHSGQVRYQGWPAMAYRVEVTLFAENDQGRDSRTWSKELRP